MAQAEILKDNTYEGTFGGDGWGAKASEVGSALCLVCPGCDLNCRGAGSVGDQGQGL